MVLPFICWLLNVAKQHRRTWMLSGTKQHSCEWLFPLFVVSLDDRALFWSSFLFHSGLSYTLVSGYFLFGCSTKLALLQVALPFLITVLGYTEWLFPLFRSSSWLSDFPSASDYFCLLVERLFCSLERMLLSWASVALVSVCSFLSWRWSVCCSHEHLLLSLASVLSFRDNGASVALSFSRCCWTCCLDPRTCNIWLSVLFFQLLTDSVPFQLQCWRISLYFW